jgi:hypothetical protein
MCSAGIVGFLRTKSRRNVALVLDAMFDFFFRGLRKLSIFVIHRFLVHLRIRRFFFNKVLRALSFSNIRLVKIVCYLKKTHSNFNSFKFKKMRRI